MPGLNISKKPSDGVRGDEAFRDHGLKTMLVATDRGCVAAVRRSAGRPSTLTPVFAEAPQPRSGGSLRPLQRALKCLRRPPAANDLQPLYGAKELCDRRSRPFALTTGRNVASWICRHSQQEDRHHAQLRTFHLDAGKRRPEFRSPRYFTSAQRSARLSGRNDCQKGQKGRKPWPAPSGGTAPR
jgi:hypothetical protein